MPFPQRSEARLCTLLIGAVQLYWSVLPIIGADWRLRKVLVYFDRTEQWFVVMGVLGLLLMISSMLPWRSARQIALMLSCSSWFGYFGMWVEYWSDTENWLISPVFMSAPLFGVFCIILLINDVMQKGAYPKRGA